MSMTPLTVISRRSVLAALAISPCGLLRGADAEWNYRNRGPESWASLDPAFGVCRTGDQQSPIDLADTVEAHVSPIRTNWKAAPMTVSNNGHSIEVEVPDGNSLEIGNAHAKLIQFHFHLPSEHAVAGKRAAMEAHFVHRHPEGKITVLAVLLDAGAANAEFAAIMKIAPRQTGGKSMAAVDPSRLLPPSLKSTWRYRGSLTTPPCSETVDWIICRERVSVAAGDIDAFRAIFPMNARPLQPLNRRFVLRGE
jgi:carbonic anhydrase